MDTIITGATIWTGEIGEKFKGDLRISGNSIAQISRTPNSLPTNNVRVIDGAGHTLVPGLTEGHAHVTFNNFSSYFEMLDMPPEENLLVGLENAKVYLDCGFTSLYSAGTVKLRLEAVIRDAVNAGRWPGPRLRACCPTITTTGGLNDERRLHESRYLTSLVADGPDEFRKTVRLAAREGNDNIKFNMTGDDDGIPSLPAHITPMIEAEVAAGMEVARLLGKQICVHSRTTEAVMMALRHGADVLYHCDLVDDRTLDAMEAAKDRITYAPSFGFFHEAKQLGPGGGFDMDRVHKGLDDLARVTNEMRKRGVRVVIGGDYGTVLTPHGTNARDIAHLVNYGGYSPEEALRCATVYGGMMMMPGGNLGQIKEGFLADLLMVKGDPVSDVRLLEDKANLSAIIKDGMIHKAPQTVQSLRIAA